MNVFHKVTRKSLRKNRTRTMVTIIGIILSAAMFTAVTSLVVSFQAYLRDMAIYNEGNWYTMLERVSWEDYESLREDVRIDRMNGAQVVGYAWTDSTNPDKPYLYIIGADDQFMQNMAMHLVRGRFPENPSEIMLPAHLKSNGGVSVEVGTQWTLDVGKRSSDGYALSQHSPYGYEEEELTDLKSRTYTVVGIYERPSFEEYIAPGYTAVTVWDESTQPQGYDVYFTTYNAKDAYAWPNEEMYYGVTHNSDLLMFSGASAYNSYYAVLYGFATVIIVLILFGSISLIYNAFSISISERTKQFGLLSSIGATKKQLRSSVIYEALLVGGVGVPLGIGAGILGIWITLMCIGNKFSGILFGTAGAEEVVLSLHVSWQSILLSGVIAMGTVLISAWLPARRATKVSAVEAIRSSQDVKVSRREVRVSRLNYKIFGLEGLLAKKYFKRDRKKYRATVVSLFMSIVLFISSSAFIIYLQGAAGAVMNVSEYDISYYSADDEMELDLFQEFSQVQGVQKAMWSSTYYGQILNLELENMTQEYRSYNGLDEENWVEEMNGMILFVDDQSFISYLEEMKEDPKLYMDAEHPRAVFCNSVRIFDGEKIQKISILNQVPTSLVLQYAPQSQWDTGGSEETRYNDLEMEIGSVQTTLPMGVESYSCVFLYPRSVMKAVIGPEEENRGSIQMLFSAPDHRKVSEAMQRIARERGKEAYRVYDEREDEETAQNTIIIINVLSYGFIVLISLIAVANVFNTISTNVALRRREFAMLRSVGMTQKGFNRMMCFECLMYGIKALTWGLPASFLMTLWIFQITRSGWETGLMIPWSAVWIAVISVFAVVFATMMYSVRKIRKENLIDALKTEVQ